MKFKVYYVKDHYKHPSVLCLHGHRWIELSLESFGINLELPGRRAYYTGEGSVTDTYTDSEILDMLKKACDERQESGEWDVPFGQAPYASTYNICGGVQTGKHSEFLCDCYYGTHYIGTYEQ
jgi:hypothetical protein